MEDIFLEQAQQLEAEAGHAPTTAECYRLIDEIAEDMEFDYEGDNTLPQPGRR